jgi:Hypothetical glycosyl hydrolase family 15
MVPFLVTCFGSRRGHVWAAVTAAAAIAVLCGGPSARGVSPSHPAQRAVASRAAAPTGVRPGPLFRVVYGYGRTTLSPAAEGTRYRVMVMQSSDAAVVPQLKARNPGLRILMYADMMASDSRDSLGTSDWVGYTDADANHPDWFLTDAQGDRLGVRDYPTAWVMDVGNSDYQQAGLAQMIAQAKAGGFDGVFLDDANASLNWILAGGSAECVTYPTNALWQGAVYSFLAHVSPQLRAAGLLVVANIGGPTVTPGLWERWNGLLDGAMEESFTNGGGARDSIENGQWRPKLLHALWSEHNRKLSLDHAVTRTRSGARYGLATMLLVADGRNVFYASIRYSREVWWPEYRTAAALGRSKGSYRVLRNGVYRRDFVHGVVLVNPHTSAASRVRLGGVYRGSGLGRVTSVRLPRLSGVVLVRS